MTHSTLAGMPEHARLWIFAAPRPLSEAEATALLERVDAFVASWKAHGHPVVGAREWRYDQFLLVAADEQATGVSGCSIDSLFRVLKESEREIGISLLEASRVWYRDAGDTIRSVTRPEFRDLVRRGEVSADTTVFDNTAASLAALRQGAWERPMRESWHAMAFGGG